MDINLGLFGRVCATCRGIVGLVAATKHLIDSIVGITFDVRRRVFVARLIIIKVESRLPHIHSHVVLRRTILVVATVDVGIPEVDETPFFVLGRIADVDEHFAVVLGFDGSNTTFSSLST